MTTKTLVRCKHCEHGCDNTAPFHRTIALLLLLIACPLCMGESGCGSSVSEHGAAPEAGFYSIDKINYRFAFSDGTNIRTTSSKARVFYSYFPGDELKINGSTTQPLFVFLNGGPGCATTLNLFSMNTAPYTLDKQRTGGEMYAVNPYSWSAMGNLLYIDAPNTGFSYNMIENPENPTSRLLEFVPANYNPLLDAAQVVRIVLRFLDEHQEIGANDVVIVGESYGGTRVTAMLNMLLYHKKYSTSGTKIYQDDELVDLIEKHFNTYFPGRNVDSELVASQFGHQILIQPQLTGPYQDQVTTDEFFKKNSIIDQIAAEEGKVWNHECKAYELFPKNFCVTTEYLPNQLNRDPYNYPQKASWSSDLEAFATQSMLNVNALSTLLGQDVYTIPQIKPANRKKACRASPLVSQMSQGSGLELDQDSFSELPPEVASLYQQMPDSKNNAQVAQNQISTLEDVFGKLEKWDDYLLGTNVSVFAAYFMASQINGLKIISADASTIYGEMFLNNLALAKTFLTDAERDLIIYSPALTESLKKYNNIVNSLVVIQGIDVAGGRAPGSVTINFKANSLSDPGITPASATIYYPYYANSGHSVSSAQPGDFKQDVENWLKQ